jgi:phosphoenolpyruvate---glycerone phosphotransferase subunit DhaK
MTQQREVPRGVLKKIINDPFAAVDEALEGFLAVHSDLVRMAAPRVVARREPAGPKVGVVVGGGSGHEPAFVGYVGVGFADAAACGNVFASPPADVCLDAIRAASSGRGVIMSYGNYSGDVLNFGLAKLLAEAEGIEVREVQVSDDVASAPRNEMEKRRGTAGDIYVFKCIGAMAERGASLDEVDRVARKVNAATRSMGVALSPCEVPGSGRPTFELPADMMEIGMGVHGEPGVRRGLLVSADELAASLVDALLSDMDARSGHEFALMVNGLGATAHLDQYILYRGARRELEAAGNTITRSHVGEFITSLEMAGASVTVLDLDDELRDLLDAPATTPAFVR